jgi:hypothetical protein
MLIMNKKVQFLGLKTINWSCGNKIKNKTKIAHCWKSSKFLSKIVVNDTIEFWFHFASLDLKKWLQ